MSAKARDSSLLQNALKLATHLNPRLRTFEAIVLLPLYAFMAWTGTALTG
jgi:hypothetical protein